MEVIKLWIIFLLTTFPLLYVIHLVLHDCLGLRFEEDRSRVRDGCSLMKVVVRCKGCMDEKSKTCPDEDDVIEEAST